MERMTLFEEYRLVERSETEVNGAWKGAHLLLFFMAFVFGSFCTFCFHMLMYLFDEKCVLFPKLLSLTSLKHNVIYEFLPVDKEAADMLPLDFLGTQWIEKSACYLPTYVPLISGIFGLVWTTMFLMCSTGSRTLTGLQRPWRVLPPVFIFSLAMGFLCTYSSAVTHYGLDELCNKLGEITGSSTCTYTVNVATLAYERRIRGVYQAIRLTVLSAWLHTVCWLLSALLALARVILAVDFQLVRVNVDLIGNIDKIMERHEKQIHTVSPDLWLHNERGSATSIPLGGTTHVHFDGRTFAGTQTDQPTEDVEVLYRESSDILFVTNVSPIQSQHALLPDESHRLARMAAYENTPKEKHFIIKMVYDLLLNMPESGSASTSSIVTLSEDSFESESNVRSVVRQLGHSKLDIFDTKKAVRSRMIINKEEAEEVAKQIRRHLHERQIVRLQDGTEPTASTSRGDPFSRRNTYENESVLNITKEMKEILESKMATTVSIKDASARKSSLKSTYVQTEQAKGKVSQKVQILEPKDTDESAMNTDQDVDKESQTNKKKEKKE